MAFTLKYGEHIRIDIFSGKFSPRTRAIIDLVGYAVVLPLIAVAHALPVASTCAPATRRNEKSGQSALNLPVWPFRVVFCLAFLLLALQVVAEVRRSWCARCAGERLGGVPARSGCCRWPSR